MDGSKTTDIPNYVIRVRTRDQTTQTVTDKREFVIGSAAKADVCIASNAISPAHVKIRIERDSVVVCDLGSESGTFLGNTRFSANQEYELALDGTEIVLGDTARIAFGRIAYEHQGGIQELQTLLETKTRAIDRLREDIGRIAGENTTVAQMLAMLHEEIGAGRKNSAEYLARAEDTLERMKIETHRTVIEKEQLNGELAAARVQLDAEKVGLENTIREQKHESQVWTALKATLAETNAAVSRVNSDLARLTYDKAAVERSYAEVGAQLSSAKGALAETEHALETGRKDLASLRAEIAQCHTERDQLVPALEEAKALSRRELEMHSTEERKRKALNDAQAAEAKQRSLAIEVSIQEIDLRRLQAEKELRAVQERKLMLETQLISAEASSLALEKRANDAKASFEDFKNAASVLDRKTAAREAEQQQSSDKARLEHAAMTQELADRARRMAADLAESHHMEIDRLKKIEAEREHALHAKLDYIVADITTYVVELGQKASVEFEEEGVRATVAGALAGRSVASLNAKAIARTRRFWRKVAMFSSGPVAIALLLLMVPTLPSIIASRIFRSVASHKDDGGVFLQQIREKGMRFPTEMDQNYRATYSQNVLYLEGYVEMKLDESEQRKWTIDLNDFITGRLGLSDRIVVDFIGAEAVLVRELTKARETIVAQYKDQGIARMVEIEQRERARMLQIIETGESYERFRAFEKSYYEDYISRQRVPARIPASKPAE
ncbi:MAG: FHA domain-containing protein [Deltaproteobacteria bacterium]|nr:FHA domain-containing protein [Deltaproteobacteria bacterium]